MAPYRIFQVNVSNALRHPAAPIAFVPDWTARASEMYAEKVLQDYCCVKEATVKCRLAENESV